jgi:hypothetical protein
LTRAQKNNNPLNLRYAGQYEANGKDEEGFAIFPTPAAGWRAAHAQIRLDQNRKLNLGDFIFKFAPPNENNTNAYLQFVMDELDMPYHIKLMDISPYALAGVMAQMEGYYNKEGGD